VKLALCSPCPGRAAYDQDMCRSIVSLRDVPDLTPDEVEAAARQFVRKVSGTKAKTPSKANQETFDQAVADIADATGRLLTAWVVQGKPASSYHAGSLA
jgi:hypothetical protein